jgi:uncharacterized membrane protein
MVLELGPGSSMAVRGAAALILAAHITAGVVGVGSGAVAMLARKGSPLHRRAGNWFLLAMLAMSLIGAAVAPFLPEPQWSSTFAGLFTAYLVVTAWLTARQRAPGAGLREIGALMFASGLALAFLGFGVVAARSPGGELGGQPAAAGFVFAAVAALAAGGDLKLVLRHGIGGGQRLARHLWRMCVALFIAAASFFLGQPQVFPESLRGSFLLFLPELAVLGALVFWLARVRRGGSGRAAGGGGAGGLSPLR